MTKIICCSVYRTNVLYIQSSTRK